MNQEEAGSEEVRSRVFKFDLYRTVVLSHYMKYWGQPLERVVSVRGGDGAVIEVYRFSLTNGTVRFATVGLFFQTVRQGVGGVEYFFALPDDLGGRVRMRFLTIFWICLHTLKRISKALGGRVL